MAEATMRRSDRVCMTLLLEVDGTDSYGHSFKTAGRTKMCIRDSVNTGDDLSLQGLEISPDLDIVTYTLGGVVNPKTGWGFRRETFRLLERLAVLGGPSWFNLGDRDLATHIYRTDRLRRGRCV